MEHEEENTLVMDRVEYQQEPAIYHSGGDKKDQSVLYLAIAAGVIAVLAILCLVLVVVNTSRPEKVETIKVIPVPQETYIYRDGAGAQDKTSPLEKNDPAEKSHEDYQNNRTNDFLEDDLSKGIDSDRERNYSVDKERQDSKAPSVSKEADNRESKVRDGLRKAGKKAGEFYKEGKSFAKDFIDGFTDGADN